MFMLWRNIGSAYRCRVRTASAQSRSRSNCVGPLL